MSHILERYFHGDKRIWMVYLLLVLASLLSMFSASARLVSGSNYSAPIMRHALYLILGFIGLYALTLVKLKVIRICGYIFLPITWLMLGYTLVNGNIGGDAARTFTLFGFTVQPSEFARLALLIVIADIIDRFHIHPEKENMYFWSIVILMFATASLIITEALSTTILLFGASVLMLIIGGFRWKNILKFIVPIILIAAIGLSISIYCYKTNKYSSDYINKTNSIERTFLSVFKRSETWAARIVNFGNKDEEKFVINDGNIQEANAAIAIARGRYLGQGPGNSLQRHYIPNADNDFIFAVIVEEYGIVGASFVMLMYLILMVRSFQVAKKSKTVFSFILLVGLTLIITMQACLHIAISTGLSPVTGQSLPLIGRGGSSILMVSAYLGIILNVSRLEEMKESAIIDNNDALLEPSAVNTSEESSE